MENFREKRLERQLKSQQSTSIVIAVILLLSVLGNVFLLVRNGSLRNEKERLVTENTMLAGDKQAVEEANSQLQNDIRKVNEQINIIRESASSLEAEIQARDSRISRLRAQVAEIDQLRLQVAELESLREEFAKLEEERKSLLAELQSVSENLSSLQEEHKDLLTRMEESSHLRSYNICIYNLRDRWLGRPVTMELARRVNRTTVSFEINGNLLVETGQKDIHLLMIDPDGDIINRSDETFTLSETGDTRNYTEYTSIQYNGMPVPLNFTITHDDRLDSGTFSMEVYIDGVIAGAREFNLQ